MWTKDKKLGEGSYGTVYLAVEDNSFFSYSSATVAVKTAKLNSSKRLRKEARILKELEGNPFIIECYGEDVSLSADGQHHEYNLTMEFASDGDLSAFIRRYEGFMMPESHVARYAYMLLRGLSHIHRKGIIHCDIKPENILVFPGEQGSNRHLKIADFGLAKHDHENIYKFRGTAYYGAPESLQWGLKGTAADIWLLGCVVLKMLNRGRQIWKQESQFESDIPEYVSESAKDFLSRCFQFVDSRWTADMLLNHSFIRSADNVTVPSHRNNNSMQRQKNPVGGGSAHQWSISCGRFSSIAAANRGDQQCSTYQLFPEHQQWCFSLFAEVAGNQECTELK